MIFCGEERKSTPYKQACTAHTTVAPIVSLYVAIRTEEWV